MVCSLDASLWSVSFHKSVPFSKIFLQEQKREMLHFWRTKWLPKSTGAERSVNYLPERFYAGLHCLIKIKCSFRIGTLRCPSYCFLTLFSNSFRRIYCNNMRGYKLIQLAAFSWTNHTIQCSSSCPRIAICNGNTQSLPQGSTATNQAFYDLFYCCRPQSPLFEFLVVQWKESNIKRLKLKASPTRNNH